MVWCVGLLRRRIFVLVCCSGGSFLGKVGGKMSRFDVRKVKVALGRAVQLTQACRRMVGKHSSPDIHLISLENQFMDAGAEVVRLEEALDDGRATMIY